MKKIKVLSIILFLLSVCLVLNGCKSIEEYRLYRFLGLALPWFYWVELILLFILFAVGIFAFFYGIAYSPAALFGLLISLVTGGLAQIIISVGKDAFQQTAVLLCNLCEICVNFIYSYKDV